MRDAEDTVEISLQGEPLRPTPRPGQEPAGSADGRPYLRLWYACAGQYLRAYRNASGTEYNSRCPKCGQAVRFPIGPGGTSDRFFTVDCR
jgi:hypothetical protein